MLLIIVVAAVAIFVIVVVLLAIAALSEAGQLHRIRFDPTARPFTLTMTDAFDPEHMVLWSTQVPALKSIRAAGFRGMSYKDLQGIYDETARTYPELYDGSSFAQWLFFLRRTELVSLGTYRVRLTEYGTEFLHYCVSETAIAA